MIVKCKIVAKDLNLDRWTLNDQRHIPRWIEFPNNSILNHLLHPWFLIFSNCRSVSVAAMWSDLAGILEIWTHGALQYHRPSVLMSDITCFPWSPVWLVILVIFQNIVALVSCMSVVIKKLTVSWLITVKMAINTTDTILDLSSFRIFSIWVTFS